MTSLLALKGGAKPKVTSSQLEALSPPAHRRSQAQMDATAALCKPKILKKPSVLDKADCEGDDAFELDRDEDDADEADDDRVDAGEAEGAGEGPDEGDGDLGSFGVALDAWSLLRKRNADVLLLAHLSPQRSAHILQHLSRLKVLRTRNVCATLFECLASV